MFDLDGIQFQAVLEQRPDQRALGGNGVALFDAQEGHEQHTKEEDEGHGIAAKCVRDHSRSYISTLIRVDPSQRSWPPPDTSRIWRPSQWEDVANWRIASGVHLCVDTGGTEAARVVLVTGAGASRTR